MNTTVASSSALYFPTGYHCSKNRFLIPDLLSVCPQISVKESYSICGLDDLFQRCRYHFESGGAGSSVTGIICPPWFE